MRRTLALLGCAAILLFTGCYNDPAQYEKDENSTSSPIQSNGKTSTDSDSDSIQSSTESAMGQNSSDTENPQGDPSADETSQAAGVVEISEERELKNEGSLRGQIAPGHKLPIGSINLAAETNVTFDIKCVRNDAKLKLVFTGNKGGEILENIVMGSDNVSFEIEVDNKYSVMIESISNFDVDFTLEYFIGGSL